MLYFWAMLFVIILGFVLIYGCYWIFKSIGDSIFKPERQGSYIDRSVTYNYHVHHHEHKNIHIIDDETKKRIIELKNKK